MDKQCQRQHWSGRIWTQITIGQKQRCDGYSKDGLTIATTSWRSAYIDKWYIRPKTRTLIAQKQPACKNSRLWLCFSAQETVDQLHSVIAESLRINFYHNGWSKGLIVDAPVARVPIQSTIIWFRFVIKLLINKSFLLFFRCLLLFSFFFLSMFSSIRVFTPQSTHPRH